MTTEAKPETKPAAEAEAATEAMKEVRLEMSAAAGEEAGTRGVGVKGEIGASWESRGLFWPVPHRRD